MRKHRYVLGAWLAATWLVSSVLADSPSPKASPTPRPRKVYTGDDLEKYRSPSPSPTATPAGGRATPGVPRRPVGVGGPPSSAGAAPYRRKPQVIVDPGAERRRKNESETPEQEAERVRREEESRGEEEEEEEDAPPLDDHAREQAAWRARAARVRTDLQRAKGAVTMAEDEVGTISQRLLMSTDTNEILRLRESQQQAEARLAQAQIALSGAELAVTNLEEEARRNSVPPGWIRER